MRKLSTENKINALDTGVLEFSKELNERFPQRRHHKRGVVHRKTTDETYSNDAVLEYLIVDCNEQRADVLGLRQVLVEPFMQGRQHRLSDLSLCERILH